MEIQAYDSHCNLVLGEVEETIYVVEGDDEEEDVKVGHTQARSLPLGLRMHTDNQEAIRDAFRPRFALNPHVSYRRSTSTKAFSGDSVVLIAPQAGN